MTNPLIKSTRLSSNISNEIQWLPCPAKINLFLHINGRLENGYHQLQSLFQLLDFGDQLGIKLSNSQSIDIKTELPGVATRDNLIFKAAMLLQKHCNIAQGADFYLDKKLPMGGGIGGGSSNAATALVALNNMWGCGLSLSKLAELGLQLGADLPIFIHGKTAFAEGVGEKLIPAPQIEKWYLVATPDVHISTAEVFQHPDLNRSTLAIDFDDYYFDKTRNDCETLVAKTNPQVANLLQWLINYAPSRMTGTGASVFSVFNSQKDAENVLNELPSLYTGFVARGVNESPLHTTLFGSE